MWSIHKVRLRPHPTYESVVGSALRRTVRFGLSVGSALRRTVGSGLSVGSAFRRTAIAAVAIAFVLLSRGVSSHETLTTTVLFDREIVRVLNTHCVMCHVENGPSFPLATYEQAWVQGRKIRSDVIARHMPPWAAFPGYGRFANDNSLTLRETQFIVSWVEGLGPRNAGKVFLNVADAGGPRPAAVRALADFDRWQLGTPSALHQLPASTVEAKEPDEVRRLMIDLRLTNARSIRGLEYKPGDRRVVRAAFFTLQETGQWLGSWTPWYGFTTLPAGVAHVLPPGSHVVAEIHYRGASDRVVDRGTLGLFFAEQARPAPASDLVVEAKGEVPAGATARKFRAATRVTSDSYILAMRPEVAPGVTTIEVSARRPNGGTEVLLFAKDIPRDWPTPYILKDPVLLRGGSELSAIAYYANPAAASRAGGIRLTVSRYVKIAPRPRRPNPDAPERRER